MSSCDTSTWYWGLIASIGCRNFNQDILEVYNSLEISQSSVNHKFPAFSQKTPPPYLLSIKISQFLYQIDLNFPPNPARPKKHLNPKSTVNNSNKKALTIIISLWEQKWTQIAIFWHKRVSHAGCHFAGSTATSSLIFRTKFNFAIAGRIVQALWVKIVVREHWTADVVQQSTVISVFRRRVIGAGGRSLVKRFAQVSFDLRLTVGRVACRRRHGWRFSINVLVGTYEDVNFSFVGFQVNFPAISWCWYLVGWEEKLENLLVNVIKSKMNWRFVH